MSLTFHDPWFLLGLLLLPAVGYMVWRGRRNVGTFKYANFALIDDVRVRIYQRLVWLLPLLRWVALGLLVLAMARPQVPDREVLSGEGVDVVIALDMSASMNAVDLTEPQLTEILDQGEQPQNRFEIARDILSTFVQNRSEDRLGLVIFGEEAFLKFPLTLDYSRILSLLGGLVLDSGERDRNTGRCNNGCTIEGSGTVIGDALGRSFQRLKGSKAKSRVIVLITDGTNEGGRLQPDTILDYISNQPEEEKVQVFTFLVGNDEQSYVPRTDPFGRRTYQRPQRAFPTNPELLKTIAAKTGGQFFESYDEASFREHFEILERTAFETQVTTQYRDVFAWFAWLAFGLLLLEFTLRLTVLRKFP